MAASPQGRYDAPSEPPEDGIRYRYRRHYPFWLIFPFMFLLFRVPFYWGYGRYGPRGGFAPVVMTAIAFALLIILVLRFALPAIDGGARFRSRRPAASAPSDGQDTRRLELELIDAHRRIKALEEQVTWQSKLLATQPAAPAAGVAASEPSATHTATNAPQSV